MEENENKIEKEELQTNEYELNAEADKILTDSIIQINPEIIFTAAIASKIRNELSKIITGQHTTIDLLIAGLFSGGNLLLEGVPGVAKTLMVKLLAKTVDTGFKRIQFTPDLMPADITGTNVFDMKTSAFVFRPGPLFSNFILADEINRAPAKTQAALIEAMEEKQVTVDGFTHPLHFPLFIVATQNPIEQEGTYKLPEAQIDRFMFKIEVGYPSLEEETAIINTFAQDFDTSKVSEVSAVCNTKDLRRCQIAIQNVYLKPELVSYIATIVHETRNNPDIFLGASPRASLALLKAAKAYAAISERNFVTPDDIKDMTYPILSHRIILSPEREIEGTEVRDVIDDILKKIEVPR